jgi:ferredoxin--NADP+ reductase
MSEVISIQEIVPNVYELVVAAPDVAAKAQPGQFAIVIPDEVGERVPMSLADWDVNAGTVNLYFLEVGVSTMKLARKQPGDYVDFMAPLGKPATIKSFGTVFVGGGCYGVGAIYPIVKALKTAGNQVIAALEARSGYLLYNQGHIDAQADELHVATSDGTAGQCGKVNDVLSQLINADVQIDSAFFMGCTFMMMRSAQMAAELNIPSYVYLNPIMVDATGMCGVCRVTVAGETRFACVDGPEFLGQEVDWKELFHRNTQYAPHEREAYQHRCRLEGK